MPHMGLARCGFPFLSLMVFTQSLAHGQNAGDAADAVAASITPKRQPAQRPGVGFLWTNQSRQVAPKLDSPADFVDLILSPAKLDVFEQVKPPVRVACIALSLERNESRPFPGVRESIQMLREADIDPRRVIIAYNPERQPGTPAREMDDLVGSARRAGEMARAYGAPLLMGPGLREMQTREDLYPELARHCQIWLIQSQRLQLDSVTRKPVEMARYRAGIQRIVDMLRQGNPRIQVYVQVVTTAERGTTSLTSEQVAGFVHAIADVVDAVRIYGGSAQLLSEVIERMEATHAAISQPDGSAPPASGPAVPPPPSDDSTTDSD